MDHLLTEELNYTPSELEMTLALLTKSGESKELGASKSITLRLPWSVIASLKAMAEHSGQSVNKIAIQTLRVGIDALADALPEADAAGIQHIRSRILCELLNAPGQVEQLGEE